MNTFKVEPEINNKGNISIGFRIWNMSKSAILLYLLKKSATWSLPFINIKPTKNILSEGLLLLDQVADVELISAICILDKEETVIIRSKDESSFTKIPFRYIVYDAIINSRDISKLKLPKEVRYAQFLTTSNLETLGYKTQILNCLISYMKPQRMG